MMSLSLFRTLPRYSKVSGLVKEPSTSSIISRFISIAAMLLQSASLQRSAVQFPKRPSIYR